MSTGSVQYSLYQLGPVHPNTKTHATLDTKPSTVYNDRGGTVTRDTGGGYERFRSSEYRPHTSRQGKESVYASHHRLLAVVECYPSDMFVGDILDHLADKDVHHTTGVEWANFGASPNFDESGIQVREHDSHSSITNAEMRAYAEDDRQRAQAERTISEESQCSKCGDEDPPTLCRVPAFDGGTVCLECSQTVSDGGEIEVLQ